MPAWRVKLLTRTIAILLALCGLADAQLSEIPHQRMPVSGGAWQPSRQPIRVAQFEPLPPPQNQPLPSPGFAPPAAGTRAPGNFGTPGDFAPPPGVWSGPWSPPSQNFGAGPPPGQPFIPAPNNIDIPLPGSTGFPNGGGGVFGSPNPLPQNPLSPNFDPAYGPNSTTSDLIFRGTPGASSLSYFAGVGYNTDLGLFGRLFYEDRDFDWTAFPWRNPPVPFRGGGQRLRLEAMPGTEAQRYLVSFTQPYFMYFGRQPVSLNLSGFYFERDYFDWDERRFGGRIGLGYNVNDALSLNAKFRVENVELSNPRNIVPELTRSLGDHDLYAGGLGLAYDSRDRPYAPSSGAYLEIGGEYVFGSFEYPRGTVDYRRYFWFRQRADTSGRHVIGLTFNGDITGSETPIYDNFFAGGYSTLRGFRFRNASPREQNVIVGGELSLLGSAEYFFPITADDMVRGLFFCDLGSVSEGTSPSNDDLRVSVGGGLRIFIPALGPTPLSIDAAVPLRRAEGDRVENLHFWVNLGY